MSKLRIILATLIVLAFAVNLSSQWTHVTDFPAGQGRFLPFRFVINDKLYMGMGWEYPQANQSDFYEYDHTSDTWTQLNNPPFNARMGAFAFTIGNYAYVGSGTNDGGANVYNDVWRYDPGTNSWTQMADFPGNGRMQPAVFVIGGKGYVAGGIASSLNTKDCWEYDPQQDTWTQKSAPSASFTTRYQAGFTDGTNGYCGIGANNDFWKYSPASDTWTQMPDLPQPVRMWAVGGTGLEPGKGFVGLGTNYSMPYNYDFYSFDFATETWSQLGTGYDFPVGLTNTLSFVLGGEVYIGTGGKEGTGAGYEKKIYKYTSCDCDDISISYTEYHSDDPDHKCCVEVNIHADCDIPDISGIVFDYDNTFSTGIADYSSSQSWTQSWGTFTNSDGYLAEGDHSFTLCIGSDNLRRIELFHLSFEDNSGNKVCSDTTIEVVCCCCENMVIKIPYWGSATGSEGSGKYHIYECTNIQVLPLPVSRVSAYVTNAYREVITNTINGPVTTIIPLRARFSSVATNHSIGTSGGSIGGWAWGSNAYAPLGLIKPYLDLHTITIGRNEIIWGDYCNQGSDLSTPTNANPANKIFNRVDFQDISNVSIPMGIQVSNEIKYSVRYYITDYQCCTRDTLIERQFEIPQASNTISLVMSSSTNGMLELSFQQNFSNIQKYLVNSIKFETIDDVLILSMKDPNTGEEAEISENIATLYGPYIQDSIPGIPIEWANPNQDFMFENKVTVFFEAYNEKGDTVDWPEEFYVIAKVPREGDPDLLEEGDLPENKAMRTIALHLTNMNVYEEPISHIMLQAATEDCKVAAVGRPVDFGDGRVLVDFSELDEELYVQSSPGGVILDSIMVPDPEYPGKRKIVPGETVQPLYITVTTPNDFEGPLVLNYKTYNEDGIELSSGELTTVVSGIIDDGGSPSELMIGCFPNPANTEVAFSIEASRYFGEVSITLTDELGNTIGNVVRNRSIGKGTHIVPYDISNLTSGSYYYTIKAGSYSKTKLLNIVR